MDYDPNTLDPELRTAKLYALASAALGVISLCAAIIPLCGGTASFLGIGFGLLSLRTENSGVAKAGIGISILGFLISVIYAIFMFISGRR